MKFKALNATYLGDYKISIAFSDAVERKVDFEKFLTEDRHNSVKKYLDLVEFKKFKIHNEKIIWGENWDIIFPTYDIHEGNINCLTFLN
jgi:Protein of unknown function (DUF2442)